MSYIPDELQRRIDFISRKMAENTVAQKQENTDNELNEVIQKDSKNSENVGSDADKTSEIDAQMTQPIKKRGRPRKTS